MSDYLKKKALIKQQAAILQSLQTDFNRKCREVEDLTVKNGVLTLALNDAKLNVNTFKNIIRNLVGMA